jgi:ABC-type transporter Mla maintaining outer membrane lipid asymmetry ATPase subunit MlaF
MFPLVCRFDAFQLINEIEILLHRHGMVKRRLFRQVADMPLGLDGLFQHIDPRDFYIPRVGGEVSGDDVHRSGLARAVGAEETHDLPLRDGERDIVDPAALAVAFG